MTFRHWISRPRDEHLPFGLGILFLVAAQLPPPSLETALLALLGAVAITSAAAIGAQGRAIRRELRQLKQDLSPGAIGSTQPTSKEEHQ